MYEAMPSLNIPQAVFTLIAAILWGGMLNVTGRWKAFDTGAMIGHWDAKAWLRFIWSTLVLSLCPIAFLVLALGLLSDDFWRITDWSFTSLFRLFIAVLPAFGIFGLYRFWLCLVQLRPKWFYPLHLLEGQNPNQCELKFRFPQLRFRNPTTGDLVHGDLDRAHVLGNLIFGLVYTCIPVLLVYVLPIICRCRG